MGLPKLIVTGLSGLIGSRFAERARGAYALVNVDISEGIDITNEAQVAKVFDEHRDAEAVIHLAAFTNVSGAYAETGNEEGPCYRINVIGTRNIAQACAARGLHLIHVSTDFVFDGTKEEPYTEEDETHPIEWYGQTKLWAEEEVKKIPNCTIIRIAFPYAAGPAPKLDLVQSVLKDLKEGKTIYRFTDQVTTPTFVGDVADALFLLAKLKPNHEIFHVTGSTYLSPYELGLKVAKAFECDAALVQPSSLAEYLKKDPRPRQKSVKLSNAKWAEFAAKHGWRAPKTIDEGLAAVAKANAAAHSSSVNF